MAKGIYLGSGGSKKVNGIYIGAGGVKKAKEIYIGVGGAVKKVWPTEVDLSNILTTYQARPTLWHTGRGISQNTFTSMVSGITFTGKNSFTADGSGVGHSGMWWEAFSHIYLIIAKADTGLTEVPQEMIDAIKSYKKVKITWGAADPPESLTLNITGATSLGIQDFGTTGAYRGVYLSINLDGTYEDAHRHYRSFADHHSYEFLV